MALITSKTVWTKGDAVMDGYHDSATLTDGPCATIIGPNGGPDVCALWNDEGVSAPAPALVDAVMAMPEAYRALKDVANAKTVGQTLKAKNAAQRIVKELRKKGVL